MVLLLQRVYRLLYNDIYNHSRLKEMILFDKHIRENF